MQTLPVQNLIENETSIDNCVDGYEVCLDNAIHDLTMNSMAKVDSLQRFDQLRKKLLSWISCELTKPASSIDDRSWPQWGWRPFINEENIRIGLIYVYKNKPIPIHDHPGANGVLLVLEGQLNITEYLRHNVNGMNQLSFSELSVVDEKNIGTNGYSLMTPANGDIHSLSTESDVSIVLDILLTPYDEKQRCWYTPVSEKTSIGNKFNTVCLNKHNK